MERVHGLIGSPPRFIPGITLKFPTKLWRIINRCNSGAVSWNISGTAIVIRKEPFEDEFLSVNGYFKTTNFASFVRQLNIYGFRKLVTRQRWYERDSIFEYFHPCFQRGHPELLPKVVRNSKKGTATDTTFDALQETIDHSRLSKVLFLENPQDSFTDIEEVTKDFYDQTSPFLTNTFHGQSHEKYGGHCGPSGDMGKISPRVLHRQVAGVVPSMDVSDEDNENSFNYPNLAHDETATLYVEIEKQKMRKDYLPSVPKHSKYQTLNSVMFQPATPDLLQVMTNKTMGENVVKSPDLVLLSQSSSESESSSSMEPMFSSILQDDLEPNSLADSLHLDTISGPEVSIDAPGATDNTEPPASLHCSNQPSAAWSSTDSGDLGSYPFPLGDTLLEYSDDDMGVFTPAYFNPSTGMVTLLLPNSAGDN